MFTIYSPGLLCIFFFHHMFRFAKVKAQQAKLLPHLSGHGDGGSALPKGEEKWMGGTIAMS